MHIYRSLIMLVLMIVIWSCKKDKLDVEHPDNNNEQETMTSLQITLTNVSNNTDVSTFKFSDPDGMGGNPPVQSDTIKLKANQIYNGTIKILDESKNPPVDITPEIEREADGHQFFYTVSDSFMLTVGYAPDDKDRYGVPLGLKPIFEAKNAGVTSLKITLKHQGKNKPRSGDGNISIGATDIEVSFPVRIIQ
ncbi:MAG: hypothetical protein NZ529_04500 [Cytophagaceae bacterium]|nr:hypothetical protein [Cytophagaceae bacterium]MDW8456035.1 hypothetical protein [Cytophagaceae bacterium]